MTDLRAFILKRQADIETASRPVIERFAKLTSEMDELRPQIEAFRAEWQELQVALRAIGPGKDQSDADEASATKPLVTIKEAILGVLAKHPTGLGSGAILEQINKDYFHGNEILRTSFSPQLSRLKADDEILMDGFRYILNPQKQDQSARSAPTLFQRRI
jgi:hypothetical protein